MRTRQAVIATAVALAVVVTAIAVIRPWKGASPPNPPPGAEQVTAEPEVAQVSLTPADPDPAGLDPVGELILSSQRPLKLAMVEEALSVEPTVALRVEQADRSGTRFRIAPAAALEPERIYRFRLSQAAGLDRDYQWSFQTRAEFRLLGTLPANRGTGVPLDTGIEFTFSHEDFEDPAAYVTFDPPIAGRWERHKNTAVFVPKDPLKAATIYTVTLREGLGRTQGEGRLGAHTFRFETVDPAADGKGYRFTVLDDAAEFPTDTVPYFRIWHPDDGAAYTVSVYRYRDAASYIQALQDFFAVPGWSSASRQRYQEPTDGLASVATFTVKPVELNYADYLALPEPLPAGYYLAEIRHFEVTRQVHFQVSDLSYYLAESTTGGLVWLNDIATGRPAAGAELYLPDGTRAATADEHGLATVALQSALNADGEVPVAFWIARSGGREVVVHASRLTYWYGADGTEPQAELYWRYLYLDRPIYKPADTVHVWGIIHPREPEARPVEEVRVEVTRGYSDTAVLAGATLPVERSSFIGSLPLPNLVPGAYMVRVLVGDEVFAREWFDVATYAKPAYQITVTPDREAVFSGETVTFRVRATFFDGTPVPDMTLNYRIDWDRVSGSVVTDDRGEAVIAYTPPHAEEAWSTLGRGSLYLSLTGGEPELGEVYEERTVRLFLRDVEARSRTEQDDDQAVVTVQAYQLEVDRSTGQEAQGPAWAGRPVEFTLVEVDWERIETGEYYDFIAKLVRKQYRYEERRRELRKETVATDAEGRAAFRFTLDPEKQYQVEYRVQDSRGLWLKGIAWVSGPQYRYDLDWRSPHLTPADPEQYRVPVGEPVDFVFQEGDSRLDDRPDGFLFFTARRGIREYTVQDTPVYTVTLRSADLPNLALYGVAFDGRSYTAAWRYVAVDPETLRLQVTVTPDREVYRPGDEVRVRVSVRDRRGRPAAGALVNLNLVDEALFAVQDQYVDILSDLHGDWVDAGVLRTRNSHNLPPPTVGAEKGGEGGGVRRDFRDAVLFTTVTTDGAGEAVVTFRVPDNLTSWRLTYQAVLTDTMEADNGFILIPVSLPFFADLVMGESYLVGERPVFQVRAYGTALAAGAQVRYQVEVEGPSGHRQRLDLTEPAFDPVSIPLEPLPAEGTYTLRVTARSGSLTDALERTFAVRQTHLVEDRVDFRLLEPGTKLSGADDGLTYVTFLDWERGRYLNLLQRMRWLWGNRLEAKLGRTVAAELLEDYFGQGDASPEPELETMRYQTADGSVAFLPYSDGDLKLTALVADLAPERFDRSALAGYLRKVRADEGERRDRRAWALYGLAALDEPVLIDAHRLLADPEATPWERLCAMLAAATLGDLETVRPVYRTFMAQHGEEIGQDVRVAVGADRDEQLQATALAAILAARLGEPQAAALISYLMDNQPAEIVLHLEQLLAARSGLENLKGKPVGLTYRLNGQEHEKTLQPGERLALALRPEELASFEVTAVRGTVAAVVTYTRPGRPTVAMDGGRVVRTYSPAPETWKPGDIVTVTLTYSLPGDAPGGAYELTDTLPSGLRYLERRWAYGQRIDWSQYDSWALQVDGQRVTFWAGKNGKPIRYFARVVSGGEYRAEEAVLMHQKSGLVYAVSSPGAVSIAW
mgnify:FL=1